MKRKITGLFILVALVALMMPALAWATPTISVTSDTNLNPYAGTPATMDIAVSGAEGKTITYQWQSKTLSGWLDVVDKAPSYSGAKTSRLTYVFPSHTALPLGKLHRCKVNVGGKTYYSKELEVVFKPRTMIPNVLLTNFNEPKAGEALSWDIESPSELVYTVTDVNWYRIVSSTEAVDLYRTDRFEAGETYACYVRVAFDDKYGVDRSTSYWLGQEQANYNGTSIDQTVSITARFTVPEESASSSPDTPGPVDIAMAFPEEGDVATSATVNNPAYSVKRIDYIKNGTRISAANLNTALSFPDQVSVEMSLAFSLSKTAPDPQVVTWNGKPASSITQASGSGGLKYVTYRWNKILVSPSSKKEIKTINIQLDELLPGEYLPAASCTDALPLVLLTTRWASFIDGVSNLNANGSIVKSGGSYEPSIQITPIPGEGYSWASDVKVYLNGALVPEGDMLTVSKPSQTTLISLRPTRGNAPAYNEEAPAYKPNSAKAKSLKTKTSSKARTIDLQPSSLSGRIYIDAITGGLKVNSSGQVVVPANYAGIGKVTFVSRGSGFAKATVTVKVTVTPATVAVKSLTAKGKGSVKVCWSKKTSCTSYQIRYAYSKSMKNYKTKKLSKKSTVSTTLKKLKKGKRVYVKIRTYKNTSYGTVYSAWSSKKSVRVK